jgi:hypothetical protein
MFQLEWMQAWVFQCTLCAQPNEDTTKPPENSALSPQKAPLAPCMGASVPGSQGKGAWFVAFLP